MTDTDTQGTSIYDLKKKKLLAWFAYRDMPLDTIIIIILHTYCISLKEYSSKMPQIMRGIHLAR